MAARVLREEPSAPAAGAVRLAFARPATDAEQAQLTDFLEAQTRRYTEALPSPEQARQQALADLCQMLLSANEFAYVD
jgi:hypothetical protein